MIIDKKHLSDLYDCNRFIDAYEYLRLLWPEDIKNWGDLTVEELILGARVANRVGGKRIYEYLLNLAWEKNPAHPLCRIFAMFTWNRRFSFIEAIKSYAESPEIDSDDPLLQSDWRATKAFTYGSMRNFKKAHSLIDEAMAFNLQKNKPWLLYVKGQIYLTEDNWVRSLQCAEESWQISPGNPFPASLLSSCLDRLERLSEASDRLRSEALNSQSYEYLGTTLWVTSALAERMEEDKKLELIQAGLCMAEKIDHLAPLADLRLRRDISLVKYDLATLIDDRKLMQKYGKGTVIPWVRKTLENTVKNPMGRRHCVKHRPVRQYHLGCLPASIASVLGSFDVTTDLDDLTSKLSYGGTSSWKAVKVLRSMGYYVCPFMITADISKKLILNDIPFVYSVAALDSNHSMAAIGLHEGMNTLTIHDPSSSRRVEFLLDSISESEYPLGPEGMVIAPAELKTLVESLIPASFREPQGAYLNFIQELEEKGINAAEKIFKTQKVRYPDHPQTERMNALHTSTRGNVFGAIEICQKLVARYPDCFQLKRELLLHLYKTSNTAEIISVLQNIVEQKRLPAVSATEKWRYPPTNFICRYADYTGITNDGIERSEEVLIKLLKRVPDCSEANHILGDILYRKGSFSEALYAYEVSAFLDEYNDHYARTYSDILCREGRQPEAFDFLEGRVKKHGNSPAGSGPWIEWIDSLASFGHPEKAISQALEGELKRSEDGLLARWLTNFWIGFGLRDRALNALQRVEQFGNRASFYGASVDYYQYEGQWQKALKYAEMWYEESPESTDVCHRYMMLMARKHGRKEASELARRWYETHEGHDLFEELWYDQLSTTGRPVEAETVLKRRLKRNPEDVWAWRELAFNLAGEIRKTGDRSREALLTEAVEVVVRLSPGRPATLALQASLLFLDRKTSEAMELYFKAIDIEPSYTHPYHKIWSLTESLGADDRSAAIERLGQIMLRASGAIPVNRQIAFLARDRYGFEFSEALVKGWIEKRPDDLSLKETLADLNLNGGLGKEGARRALPILAPLVARYPNHMGIRSSMADAYLILEDIDEVEKAFIDIIKRQPGNSDARHKLARAYLDANQIGKAVNILKDGTRADPLDEDCWNYLSTAQWDSGARDIAIQTLVSALEILPASAGLRERLVEWVNESGDHLQAVQLARQGTALCPESAIHWSILGDALLDSKVHTSVEEIERAYRMSLKLDLCLYRAADSLSTFLTGQSRFAEARDVVETMVERNIEPAAAGARSAWITRQEGQDEKALNDMKKSLFAHPNSLWGWWTLMDWLSEDGNNSQTIETLSEVPPSFMENPVFASRRLEMLDEAGLSDDELSAKWEELLTNFPKNTDIYCSRVDILLNRGKIDEARETIDLINSRVPYCPFIGARLVKILSAETRTEEALTEALKIWESSENEQAWAPFIAFETLWNDGWSPRAVNEMVSALLAGRRLCKTALEICARNIYMTETLAPIRQYPVPLSEKRRKGLLERIYSVLQVLVPSSWDDGSGASFFLEQLCIYHGERQFSKFLAKCRTECIRLTPLWSKTASLFERWGRNTELKGWMDGWQKREDVTMASLYPYLKVLKRDSNFLEIYGVAKQATETLCHDEYARTIIALHGEACLRLGFDDELCASVDRWQSLLESSHEKSHIEKTKRWLPSILVAFCSLIKAKSPDEALRLSGNLPDMFDKHIENWVTDEWATRLGRIVSPWDAKISAMKMFLWKGIIKHVFLREEATGRPS